MAAALLREGVLALRQGVLASVRVPLAQQGLAPAPALARCFSSYLDKQQVQDRVLQVVKTFEKVEEGKVSTGEAARRSGARAMARGAAPSGRRRRRQAAAAGRQEPCKVRS